MAEMAAGFQWDFAHNWMAEVLTVRPMILPTRHYTYPAVVEEVEKGALEVLVRRGEEQPWLATCALGFRDAAAPTGLWAMPDPDWLCAVSGGYAYLIDTREPERFVQMVWRPVLQVRAVSELGLLLFVGHHAMVAWGRDGLAWESERLSWEGVTIDRVEGETLHGSGWDLMTDRETPFALDLTTGLRRQG